LHLKESRLKRVIRKSKGGAELGMLFAVKNMQGTIKKGRVVWGLTVHGKQWGTLEKVGGQT